MGDRSAAGDVEWIRAAVREYEHKLIAYAAHLVGNRERGRDLAQETFMRLCGQDRARSSRGWRNGFLPSVATSASTCVARNAG